MSELWSVYPVFVIWLLGGVICWVFIFGAMLPPCRVTFKQLKGRDKRTRNAVKAGMNSPLFWLGFWGSLVGLAINTLAPLGLAWSLPAWSVAGIVALNAASNVLAIPLRWWIWNIHTDTSLMTHN